MAMRDGARDDSRNALRPILTTRWLACAALLAASVGAAPARAVTLTAADAVTVATDSPAVLRAAQDVARDLKGIFAAPVSVARGAQGRLVAEIDANLPGPESYRIVVSADAVRLVGSDELGAVYALYDFTHRFAGVDPLWYWTERRPPKRDRLEVPQGTIEEGPPRFRYRGLFINDEDLLGRWQTPAGERFLDHPERRRLLAMEPESEYQRNLIVFYGPIVNSGVMEAVYETILRLHGNLVIPASFVDVMNPAEAELIRRAVARGLYVSQHHVEPVGVSFFGFMSYWHRQGRSTQFSYPSERELFHRIWQDSIAKWHALAGDKVLWQLGLRGRGDRAAWVTDPAFDREKAGSYISDALAAQVAAIRQVDRRPHPPMTLTLWLEMSQLIERGQVVVPPGVVLVHTDQGSRPGAAMNPSFDVPRRDRRKHSAYLHVAVWGAGPHLVQGIDHERLIALIGEIAAKGDTDYAIVNAANVREHVLPLRTAMDQLWRGGAPSALDSSVPAAIVPAYRRLVELQRFEKDLKDILMNDGRARGLIRVTFDGRPGPKPELAERLAEHSQRLEALAAEALAVKLSADEARFVRHNLSEQAEILAGIYRAAAAVRRDRPADVAAARQALESVRRVFARQQGRWATWYRGDTKINVEFLLEKFSQK